MRIAVQDANVFIDLELAGLYDLWLQMGVEVHTTDLIRMELERGNHRISLSYLNGMVVHELSFEELVTIAELEQSVANKAKFNDCSVLYLAEKLKVALISGDGALRTAAKKRGVEVRGTLWIFDSLIERKLLAPAVAAEKLHQLLLQDRHLPKSACDERLTRWGNL
jgi:predicted nucleic acid-binding protein